MTTRALTACEGGGGGVGGDTIKSCADFAARSGCATRPSLIASLAYHALHG